MSIEKKPFVRYNEEKKTDSFTCKLNEQERKVLEECKQIIQQTKDSTALKQLAWLGAEVILDKKTATLLDIVFNNKRKNSRLGIVDFD